MNSALRVLDPLIGADDDSSQEGDRKRVAGMCCIGAGAAAVIAFAFGPWAGSGAPYFTAGASLAAAASCVGIGVLVAAKDMPQPLMQGLLAVLTVAVALADFDAAYSFGERRWPLFLLLLNVHVVSGSNAKTTIALVLVWLLLLCLETAFRFGIYDIGGTSSPEDRKHDATDCAKPPCEAGARAGVRTFILQAAVLLVNYLIVSRGQAALQEERRSLAEAAESASQVLDALCRFDLDVAEKLVRRRLATTLHKHETDVMVSRLLSTLKAFRPHLAPGMLDSVPGIGEALRWEPVSSCPPSTTRAAIVVASIHQSARLWRAIPGAMRTASRLFADALRSVAEAEDGYEIRSVGDSYLLAFPTAGTACRFALSLHEAVLRTDWPLELSDRVPLKLRVGVHYGDVTPVDNPVTGRVEYFGDVVRKAACIEGVCVPGSVAVSEETISVIRRRQSGEDCVGSDFTDIGSPVVLSMGSVDLPGFPESYVAAMLPTAAAEGKTEVKGEITARHEHRCVQEEEEVERDDEEEGKGSGPASEPAEEGEVRLVSVCEESSPPGLVVKPLEDVPCITAACIAASEHIVAAAVRCVECAEGVVFAFHGDSVVAGWNAIRRCHGHYHKALRCAALLFRDGRVRRPSKQSGDNVSGGFAIGISTGTARCGVIRAGPQHHFPTVTGGCVRLSRMLASSACDLGSFCLTASPPASGGAEVEPRLQTLFRPVDVWSLADLPAKSFGVFEVRVSRLDRSAVMRLLFNGDDKLGGKEEDEDEDRWAWSPDYAAAFAAGDHAAIVAGASRHDVVAAKVATFLEHKTHLRLPVHL